MGLEFTAHPDRQGPAVYLISDGSSQSTEVLQQLAEEVDTSLPDESQVVLLDGSEREAVEITDFYDIQTLPAILIVMDDDQIHHGWYGHELPAADRVLYMMGQAGARLRGDQ